MARKIKPYAIPACSCGAGTQGLGLHDVNCAKRKWWRNYNAKYQQRIKELENDNQDHRQESVAEASIEARDSKSEPCVPGSRKES